MSVTRPAASSSERSAGTAEAPRSHRVAFLTLHSHSDRSFLDDREIALVSGDLRGEGVDNDLVVAVLRPEPDDPAEERLVEALASYDVVVYERIWSARIIDRLRARLPGRVFIHCRGEHTLDAPPADYVCEGDLRATLPRLLGFLAGTGEAPEGALAFREGVWAPLRPRIVSLTRPVESPSPDRPYAPNLWPRIVTPERLPPERTFSITGNDGCPYQADARDNPLYEGVRLPAGMGRGCAFCTTGNRYAANSVEDTRDRVLEQIRYIRRGAPELRLLVLKDQNPFAYLADVLEAAVDEGVPGFSLLLETRADWFLRSARRLERALAHAHGSGIRLAPFLVGIESFSQRELDRFNKGISAETNEDFLTTLFAWKERFGDTLDLGHASFGFVLFTPWTTFDDLWVNLRAIERTGLARLRGKLLLSRARLYPDTALYYLAERDGLLTEAFGSVREDASMRFGYFPAHPWRFLDLAVARFAEIATEVAERTGGRDEPTTFRALLDAFSAASDPMTVTVDEVLGRLARGSVDTDLRRRLGKLLVPLSFDRPFAGGFRFGGVRATPGLVVLELVHPDGEQVVLELGLHGDAPRLARTRHYDVRVRGTPSPTQLAAAVAVGAVLTTNDR